MASNLNSDRAITRWLTFVMLLVMLIIVVGGATRLTNSGLSITAWELLKGVLPPMSESAWQAKFDLYKTVPEYLAEHADMTLDGFKTIFYWEWGHRMLGRFIGLAYALPFLYFLKERRIPKGKMLRFFLIMVLIGMQGVIGWFMVHSGLDDVSVSPYWLAAHLGTAFIILGLLYWTIKDQKEGWSFRSEIPSSPILGTMLGLTVFLQIVAGAFVAGTKAGSYSSDWPDMGGRFVPTGYIDPDLSPFWKNLFENTAAIHFNHRTLAYLIVILAVIYWMRVRTIPKIKGKATMFMVLLFAQVALGIATIMNFVPLHLALTHQFLAIFVWISVIGLWRGSKLGY